MTRAGVAGGPRGQVCQRATVVDDAVVQQLPAAMPLVVAAIELAVLGFPVIGDVTVEDIGPLAAVDGSPVDRAVSVVRLGPSVWPERLGRARSNERHGLAVYLVGYGFVDPLPDPNHAPVQIGRQGRLRGGGRARSSCLLRRRAGPLGRRGTRVARAGGAGAVVPAGAGSPRRAADDQQGDADRDGGDHDGGSTGAADERGAGQMPRPRRAAWLQCLGPGRPRGR